MVALLIGMSIVSGCGTALPTSPIINPASLQSQTVPQDHIRQASANLRDGGGDGEIIASGGGSADLGSTSENLPNSTPLGGLGQGQGGGSGKGKGNGKGHHRGWWHR